MTMQQRKPQITQDAPVAAPAPPNPELASAYPVPFYNPIVIDERFAMPGSTYRLRFANGRFFARNSEEAEAVSNALRFYGADKPTRWRGDDRTSEWVCKRCGFRTMNDTAKEDHEGRH